MPLIEHIINLIAPHSCLSCGVEGTLLCAVCTTTLEPAVARCYRCLRPSALGQTCEECRPSASLSAVYSFAVYNNVAKDILHKLKFERSRAAIKPIAASIMSGCQLSGDSIASYVPTATTRVRMRGYDQAHLIARSCAVQARLPVLPLLRRTANTRQVGSSATERRQQQYTAFRIINERSIKNSKILLFDDVITTGTTLEACARLLREAGAARVEAITFAQA